MRYVLLRAAALVVILDACTLRATRRESHARKVLMCFWHLIPPCLIQEEETAADYYFDSYAHFGKPESRVLSPEYALHST